jgi:hypothetical protein
MLCQPGEIEVAAVFCRDIPVHGIAFSGRGGGEPMQVDDSIRRLLSGGIQPYDAGLIIRLQMMGSLLIVDIACQRGRVRGNHRHVFVIFRSGRGRPQQIEDQQYAGNKQPP